MSRHIAGITPDGTWLYITLDNWLAVYKRDIQSGSLKLQEAGSGNESLRPDFRLANQPQLNLVFLSDGKQGFIGNNVGLLQTFHCDPATGRLSDISDAVSFMPKCYGAYFLNLDERNGFLYGGSPGGKNFPQTAALWTAKITLPLPEGERSDINTPLVGEKNASGESAKADWPRRKGPNGDGTSPLKGIKKNWSNGLKKVWEVTGLSPGTRTFSTVSIKGSKLIVTGRHGQMYQAFCFDADKGGRPFWTADFAYDLSTDYGWGDGPYNTPSITEDSVYVAGKNGQLVRINLDDGKVRWRAGARTANHGYGSCPVEWGNSIIAPGIDRKQIGAVDKETGKVLWSWNEDKSKEIQHSSPQLLTINGVEQFLFKTDKQLLGFDKNGKVLWSFPSKKSLAYITTPAIKDTIIVNVPATGVKLNGTSGELLWDKFEGTDIKFRAGLCDPIIIGDHVYASVLSGDRKDRKQIWGGGYDGYIICAEVKTGKITWIEKTGQAAIIAVDGHLLGLNFDGDLFLIEARPDKFNKVAEIKSIIKSDPWMHHGIKYSPWGYTKAPFWSMAIVARGNVYVRYSDTLACFSLME
jgi:outer membrane protein assembly factor BamB